MGTRRLDKPLHEQSEQDEPGRDGKGDEKIAACHSGVPDCSPAGTGFGEPREEGEKCQEQYEAGQVVQHSERT